MYNGTYSVLYILIILTNIVFIITTIFFEHKKPLQALSWVLTLSLLPGIGFVLYLLFGRNLRIKKKRSLVIKQQKDRAFSHEIYKLINNVTYDEEAVKKYTDYDIRQLVRLNINSSNSPFTNDNNIKIYTDASDKYKDLLNDINEATSSIHLLYYIIRNDSIGKEVISALATKAEQGVAVRLLYDYAGSFFTPNKFFEPLIINGGEVLCCFPLSFGLRINFRNHRKIVVIDGKIGYMGGINIGDEYMGLNKRLSPWRDTHLRIMGSSVYCLQVKFLGDWFYASRDDLKLDDVMKYFMPIDNEFKGSTGVQIVSSGPDTKYEEIKRGLIKMINSAKKRVLIQTPYFVPDDPFLETLQNQAMAGVEVIVQIPLKADRRFVYKVTNSFLNELFKYGIKVYLYPGFLHAKMVVVDDSFCSIGTANIDIRSFALNFEVNAFLYGKEISDRCTRIFFDDLEKCTQLTLEKYKQRSVLSKVEEDIYRLLSPLL